MHMVDGSCSVRHEALLQALKDVDKDTLKKILGDVPLPSWITFPDFERVGWVNDTIEQLWPYINDAICTSMRERLNPLLAQSKPGWISSIKLFRQAHPRLNVGQHCCTRDQDCSGDHGHACMHASTWPLRHDVTLLSCIRNQLARNLFC